MAGRKAAPKPAAKPNRRRDQGQVVHERHSPNPRKAVNHSKIEKDVVKLIDCLATWTRDLQASRPTAAEGAPRSRRSPPRVRRAISRMPPTPLYPRGNPLTQSMEFTDRDGAVWLAYIEGAGPAPRQQERIITVLPSRRLRFDCATESRFTPLIPAGSPFLAETRLQSLLDQAAPDLPVASTIVSRAPGKQRRIAWSTRAVTSGRETIADWARRWRQGATQREEMRRKARELRSEAATTVRGIVDELLDHRPARSWTGRRHTYSRDGWPT